jgi:hypothetical protein
VKKITAWSFSRWSTWSDCPRKAKYAFIDKLPQPEGKALVRGKTIHTGAEHYVNGTRTTLIKELKAFRSEFKEVRDNPLATAEGEWSFRVDWTPTGWFSRDAWCRIKVDIDAPVTDVTRRIIDVKTGKEYDSHAKQMELYALGAFKKYPDVKKVTTELWYTDGEEIVDQEYVRAEEDALQGLWERRTSRMLSDTRFTPNTGNHCRWCPFSKGKGGPCEAA